MTPQESRAWGQQEFESVERMYADDPDFSDRFVKPRYAGIIATDDDGSWRKWAVFPRAAVESAHGPLTPDTAETIAGNLTGWGRSYSGPGRNFASDPSIRRIGKGWIAITQSGGLDI